MIDYKLVLVSMNLEVTNFLFLYNRNIDRMTIKQYQSAIRFLMQPTIHICPNIAYSIKVFNCYCSNLRLIYYNPVIQIFKYPKDDLIGYIDSNYAGFIDSQKFISNYIFILFDGFLSHQLKLQNIIALSFTKAKYMVVIKLKKEALLVVQFFTCFRFCLPSQPVKLCADNKKTITLIKNLKFYQKKSILKYIGTAFEKQLNKKINILYTFTKKIRVNRLTKMFSPKIFKDFQKIIRVT